MVFSVWGGTDGSCESPCVFTVVINNVLPLWGSRTAKERQDPPVKVKQECLCHQDDQPGEESFRQLMMAKGEYNKQLSVGAINGMASRVIGTRKERKCDKRSALSVCTKMNTA